MKTTMHQPTTIQGHNAQLVDPGFYNVGQVATVTCDYGRIVRINREGRSRVCSQEDPTVVLTTPDDFRDAFGTSGQIPHEDKGWDWENNGWFALYAECGRPIGDRDNLAFDLNETIAEAQEWLITTGTLLIATAVQAAA